MRAYLGLLVAGGVAMGSQSIVAEEIRIGFANPLSGPYAVSGHRNEIAVDMAIIDINENGGLLDREVRMVAIDDACGLEQAVAAARELIKAEVDVVIGHMCSHASLLAAGLYETADTLMITPDSTHPRVTEEGRRNVFRLIGRNDQEGRLAAEFLARRWPGEQIAIVHDGSTYGEAIAATARKHLRERGEVEAIYDFFAPGEQDFEALVTRLHRERIGVVYVGGYGPDAGRIARAAREIDDFDLQIVGGDSLDMDELWDVAGNAGEGVIFSERRNDSDALTANMLERLEARGIGERVEGIAAYYAAVEVWAQAVERAGTLDTETVADTLRRSTFDTIVGSVAFDEKGDLEGAAWQWMMWSEGIHVPLSDAASTQ